jgi:Tfp pilus assembly protein PilF
MKTALVICVATILSAQPILVVAGTSDLTPATIFRSARQSVVLVIGGDRAGKPTVQGSGFIIAPNRVVTNHHVLAGVSQACVVFSDGATAEITSVASDSASNDLTVVVAKTGQRQALRLGDEQTLQQGDPVYAIGAPQGLDLTLTNGIVSAFRNIDGQFLIQTTAVIGHGSSGGPLFDRRGSVVGVTSSMLSDTPGIYFAVSAGDVKRLLKTPERIAKSFSDWAGENADVAGGTEASGGSSIEANAIAQIDQLLREKKFDQARDAIREISSKAPNSEIISRLTGQLDLDSGNNADAVKELDVAVQQEPRDSAAQFYYAIALLATHDYALALEHEKIAYSLEPTSGDLLAALYYATHDYKQARVIAQNVIAKDATDSIGLGVLAGSAYRERESGQPSWKDYAKQIQAVDADSFWPHMLQAYDAFARKQTDEAITALRAAEKDDFPDDAPYLILAGLYNRTSDIGRASDQVRAGLAQFPDDAALLAEGVYVSLRGQNETEAGRRLATLEHDHPNTVETASSGCLYYYGIGQALTALSYCARNVALSPNDHTAHSNYGWAAIDANQVSLAQQEFKQAWDLSNQGPKKLSDVQTVDLLWGSALASYAAGDRKGTRIQLQTIRTNYPQAATITGLHQTSLLWSTATMGKIEALLKQYPN